MKWGNEDENGWRFQAACRGEDPNIFFPEVGDWKSVREAKAICSTCPVKAECLKFALDFCLCHGVYGGTSEKQRKLLRRSRRQNGCYQIA